MCNPGGAAAMMGMEKEMEILCPGITLTEFEEKMGRELGVVRVSLGLASDFQDVWRVIQFATSISQQQKREAMWDQWMESQRSDIGQAL